MNNLANDIEYYTKKLPMDYLSQQEGFSALVESYRDYKAMKDALSYVAYSW